MLLFTLDQFSHVINGNIQGHPTEVFRKIGVPQGYVCRLGENLLRVGNMCMLLGQDTHMECLGIVEKSSGTGSDPWKAFKAI